MSDLPRPATPGPWLLHPRHAGVILAPEGVTAPDGRRQIAQTSGDLAAAIAALPEWIEAHDAAAKKLTAIRSLCSEAEATPDTPPGYMDGWDDLARAVRRIIDEEQEEA